MPSQTATPLTIGTDLLKTPVPLSMNIVTFPLAKDGKMTMTVAFSPYLISDALTVILYSSVGFTVNETLHELLL